MCTYEVASVSLTFVVFIGPAWHHNGRTGFTSKTYLVELNSFSKGQTNPNKPGKMVIVQWLT